MFNTSAETVVASVQEQLLLPSHQCYCGCYESVCAGEGGGRADARLCVFSMYCQHGIYALHAVDVCHKITCTGGSATSRD